MSPARRRILKKNRANNGRDSANFLAIASIAFFFISSGLALLFDEVFSTPSLSKFILLAGPAFLWVAKRKLKRKPFNTKDYRRIQFSLLFVTGFTFLSATAALLDPALNAIAIRNCLVKTGGLIYTFYILATCVSAFKAKEVYYALIVFALFEFVTIGAAALVFNIDLNPNAVGVRIATSGLVLFSVLPRKAVRSMAWIASLAVAFVLQCRTSMVASIGALVARYFEAQTRTSRGSIIFFTVIACLTWLVIGEDITNAIRKTATTHLHSTNPIARFFLSDKDQRDVSGDFFDREYVWTAMIRRIKERPFFGYGIGAESALFRTRSHNAYLSLLIEGGVGLLASWMFVYGLFIKQTLSRSWVTRFANGPIGKLQVLLFAYLALAAMVESSGIGSISTPNNIIFLFLLLWVSPRLAIPISKKRRPAVNLQGVLRK